MHTESKKSILSDATILLVLNITASGLNYVFQIAAAKVLGVANFGILNGVFSFITIIAVPGTMLTMVMSRRIALYNATNRTNYISGFVKQMTRNVVFLSFTVCAVEILFHKKLEVFLNLQNITQLVLIILICMLGYFHPYYSGCMSGYKSFYTLGLYGLMIPLYKLAGLWISSSYANDYRLGICFGSIGVGSFITLFAGYLFLHNKLDKQVEYNVERLDYKELLTSLLINLGLIIYLNADILAVRYNGDDVVTGLYSAASLFGRVIYYIAVSAGTVLIPYVAGTRRDKAQKILLFVLGVVLTITILFVALMNAFGDTGILLVYGNEYLEATIFLPYVGIIAISMACISILSNYAVGIGKTIGASVVMFCLAITVLFIIRLDISEIQKLLYLGIIGLCVSVVLFVLISIKDKEIQLCK